MPNRKETLMNKTGVLRVDQSNRVSRLENWRKLALEGEDAPLQAATDFLADAKGLDDGDTITVTGTLGSLDDGTPVCFITDAVKVSALVEAGSLTFALGESSRKSKGGAKKGGAKKAAKGGGRSGAKRATRKSSRKSTKKTGAKKGGSKKGAARRSTKKPGRK
jgi:hypothetical protein